MSRRKPPSEPMRAFCSEVNRVGARQHGPTWTPVTPTKVERWLDDDLLPAPARPGRGRGAGRAARYTEHHVQATVEVACLVKDLRALDLVALVLFVRGREVPAERVRRGYLGAFDRLLNEIELAAKRFIQRDASADPEEDRALDAEDVDQLAEWSESVIAHRLQRDPRTRQMRKELAQDNPARGAVGAGLQGLAQVLVSVFTASSTFDIDALRAPLGLKSSPAGPGEESQTRTDDDLFRTAAMHYLEEFVRQTEPNDFEWSRSQWQRIDESVPQLLAARLSAEQATVVQTVLIELNSDVGQALSALIPLILRKHLRLYGERITNEEFEHLVTVALEQ